MLIKLDKNSTIAEGLDALGGRVVGCYADGEPFNTHNGGVVGAVSDLSGRVSQLCIAGAWFSLYLGWSIVIETETVPETLLEHKARLEKELAEVSEAIAKDGAPEGFTWGENSLGTTLHNYASDEVGVSWGATIEGERKVLVIETTTVVVDANAAMIFAWVDRVRERGETDL